MAMRSVRRWVREQLRPLIAHESRVASEGEADRVYKQVYDEVPLLVAEQVEELLETSPLVAAKAAPIDRGNPDLVLPLGPDAEGAADGDLPLPPVALWGVVSHYLEGGAAHLQSLEECLASAGAPLDTLPRILDFGCGTGRLIRHLVPRADAHTIWGVDVDAARIEWARSVLSPPLHFSTCTTLPHLPFDDQSFDLVFAGSVFTHISELADMWLLELKRVTQRGGYLFLTIQDQAWVDATLARTGEDRDDWLSTFLKDHAEALATLGTETWSISIGRANGDAMVIYDRDALLERWGQDLEVVAVFDQAFYAQTGVLLRRPVGDAVNDRS